MIRSLFVILAVSVSNVGCSLLAPPVQHHSHSSHAVTASGDYSDVALKNDVPSAEIAVAGDNVERPIIDAVFRAVFVPVYTTGVFIWWVAHGFPDP